VINFLREIFEGCGDQDAIIHEGLATTYYDLLSQITLRGQDLRAQGISPGMVVALETDFSPRGIATFLALTEMGCIIVPLSPSVYSSREEYLTVAGVQVLVNLTGELRSFYSREIVPTPEPYARLKDQVHPGLVLFSSGSTGKSKAAVHDLSLILDKFRIQRKRQRTISFLMFDHIGGINTMLHTLSNGGCLIVVPDRTPDGVLFAIEEHEAEVLPTSPTFLNMVLVSEAYKRHDLSSLRLVTYGTEPMPQATLNRLHAVLPHVQLQQTYGLSELGILRSKSASSDSLWVKIGGEGYETRVVDGILQIKAKSAMLGYLNAPSPFTEDGWFVTGDEVDQEGEYFLIRGRRSEIINVGGQKVWPAEIEGVIQELLNVSDVTVYGEPNAITGQIVCARVALRSYEPMRDFVTALKLHCHDKLPSYKVPARVTVTEDALQGERFKKKRGVS
jgi:acyl-coenzyme A synthetase/AMP-(fatty) acid ligase